MHFGKLKLMLLAGIALSATLALGVAQNAPARVAPPSLKTGIKTIQVLDITPSNQIWPRVHAVYDFDNYTVTTVEIRPDSTIVGRAVSLLKATPLEVEK